MAPRDHDRSSDLRDARSRRALARRAANPVLALQQAVGNRGTTQMLARKGSRGTFEHSVRIGKLGPIEILDSNIADWVGKKADAEDLTVTTTKGKHSDELKRLADSKTRLESIEVSSVTGQNTWVTITFKNAIIAGYAADGTAKTEQWKATRFDGVDIQRTSIGKPRP